LEPLTRSHDNVYREVAGISVCGDLSAGETSNNHNNSTSRNDNTPWGKPAEERGFGDYGSFYDEGEFYA
jgi:hypothetical protein